MPDYRLDDLTWADFEKLCQALLKASLGVGVEAWGGRGDWGRDAYCQVPLRYPGSEVQDGPFQFQAKFVEGANAAGAKPQALLLDAVRRECQRIKKRKRAIPRVYSLLTNAVFSPDLRVQVEEIIRDTFQDCATVISHGGDDICVWLHTHPEVVRHFPQLLSYRDLSELVRQSLQPVTSKTAETQDLAGVVVDERSFMVMAINEARKSEPEDGRTHPRVGAVVVSPDGCTTIGHRGELEDGEHAEYTVLERKLKDATVAGSTVYVTLEPCTTRNHPKIPCAARLAERRVRSVRIGMLDPDSRICGRGVACLRAAGIEVRFFDPDLMAQVEELNRDFIRAKTVEERVHETPPSPPEEAAALDREACEDLARTYSSRGEHRRAIEWGLRALQHSKREGLLTQAGRTSLLIAQQCRHQGRFNEALRYYAQAEQCIRESGVQGFEARTDLLRISAGRAMTEKFLVLGDSNAALYAYEAIGRELEDLRASNPDRSASNWLHLFGLHLQRQQAELYRQVGLYSDSLQLFDELYQNYSYVEVAPKAWSLLGKAEAARMLGRIDEAVESYRGAESFASKAPDFRLLARVLRNRAELARSQGLDPVPILEELEEVVKKNDYLYGRIYFLLIRGGHELDIEAFSSAISTFHEARTLCRADGRPIGTEAVHAILGLAEAYRLSGQLSEAESLLRQARDDYSRKGIAWGYLRAILALTSISDSSDTRMPESEERADASFLQLIAQRQGVSSRTVFVNLL